MSSGGSWLQPRYSPPSWQPGQTIILPSRLRIPSACKLSFPCRFTGEDPLLRHVRTRVKSPQTNGVIERFFGPLKYEHLYRGPINDGDALAVEVNRFRQIYNTIRPHQALHDRTPRDAYLAGR